MHTGDHVGGVAALACRLGVVTGAPEAPAPLHADVGRELARDVIAQAQPGGGVGQAAADAARRIVLAVGVELELRLQHHALGQQQFIAGAQAQGAASLVAQVAGGLDVEPVRRQALHAEGQPVAVGASAVVVANAELRVPVGRDGVPPQQLGSRILQPPLRSLPFGLEHRAVEIAPVPRLHVVGGPVAGVVAVGPLQAIHQHGAEALLVRHARRLHAGRDVRPAAQRIAPRIAVRRVRYPAGSGRSRLLRHRHARHVHSRHGAARSGRRPGRRGSRGGGGHIHALHVHAMHVHGLRRGRDRGGDGRCQHGSSDDRVHGRFLRPPGFRGTCPNPCASSCGSARPSAPPRRPSRGS